MSSRTRIPASSRPGTPSGLGLSQTNDNNKPTLRSVSSGSSSSLRNSTPCFHTTRPQFISSHIDRCEACRLKYARQAESSANIPFSTRRTSALNPQPRSQSRQSLGGNNRPTSSASVGTPSNYSTFSSNTASAMRPSSRASVASVASRGNGNGSGRRTRQVHRRSSSTGSPLVGEEDNGDSKNSMASVAEETPTVSIPTPPPRTDNPLSSMSSSDGVPVSPTETVAIRARNRSARNNPRAQGSLRESTMPSGQARQSRRGSSHSIHTLRRADNDSPVGLIRTAAHRSASSQQPPLFPDDIGRSSNEEAVDITSALMGTLVDRTRDMDKMRDEYEATIAQLQETVRKLRRDSSSRGKSGESPKPQDSQSSDNIFGVHLSDAKQKMLERKMNLDRSAIDKFEEFRKAYEDCEPSLRLHRAQFAGERPLSPPPARNWGGGVSTPMRSLDGGDQDARRATINAAEVRRAGEDLMSTPVRRKPQHMARGTSTRRPAKSRMNRPLFGGDSELSEDALDEDDLDDDEDEEHRDLRNCLMSASNFGTFLVQYVTRQCLDYNMLCDENKMVMLRFDELEKKMTQVDKLNKRLEEARDEQVAQAYDMSAQREMLADKVDHTERNARRLANENDRLKHELANSNERCAGLDDQIAKASETLSKVRQRYEQEAITLRRNTNSLQQEKTTLAKKNDELRTELKGRLQRAGLKANVDEYLAERRRENVGAGADGTGGDSLGDRSGTAGVSDGVAAENEIKRLQETVQFWRKKTDRVNRKLRLEKTANKEAHRMLRIQQEETYRYQQTFGPLPEDAAGGGAEVLGDFMSSMIGSPSSSSRRPSIYSPASATRSIKEAGSDASNDALSSDASDSSSDLDTKRHRRRRGSRNGNGGNSSMPVSPREPGLVRFESDSSLSTASENDPDADENADDKDIRRYEMRMKNRRAIMATPRSGRAMIPKSPKTTGARRGKNTKLSVDVGATSPSTGVVGGESLGDILGAGSQWGDLSSARSKTGSAQGQDPTRPIDGKPSSSLAAELGGIDGFVGWGPNSSARALSPSSPSSRSRARSIRGTAPPFGDRSNSFGLGFGESVSLAEQLSEATNRQLTLEISRPPMVDASTSTDPLPAYIDAQVATALASSSHADASVFAALSPPSSEASICTVDTEPDAYRSTGVDPQVSVSELADNGMQTVTASTEETGVQATTTLTHQQTETDPLIGVAHVGVETISAPSTDASVQATSTNMDVSIATAVLASLREDKAVESVVSCSVSAVQAVPSAVSASMSTDPRIGVTDSGTQSKIAMCDQACQNVAITNEQEMATDPTMYMVSKQVEAIAASCDSMMSTVNPVTVDRGSDAVLSETAEATTSTEYVQTCDMEIATDISLLLSWLAPLIPEGIATSTVLASLAGKSEPVYEHYAKQVADDARAAARAEHERLAALSAEEAAACVKTYVDRAVSPEPLVTSERAVQATPHTTSTSQQPYDAPVSHAGVDAPAPPELTDASVATEHHTVTRWVEPFDPVTKADIGILAAIETADCGISHEIEYADAAVESVVKSMDAYVAVFASVVDQSTSTGIVMKDASVGRVVDLYERAVSPIVVDVSSVAVGTSIATESKGTGTEISVADKTTSNVTECSSVCVVAGCADSMSVGTYTTVDTMEQGTDCVSAAVADCGIQPEGPPVSHAGVAATVPVEHAAVSPVISPKSQTEDRGISTDVLSSAVADISAVREAPSAVDEGTSAIVSQKAVATQTESEQFEHVGYSHTSSSSPADDSGVRAVESFESIERASGQRSTATNEDSEAYDDARAAQSAEDAPVIVLARPSLRHSPTMPLPHLPSARPSLPELPSHIQTQNVSSVFPPTKAMSALELERVLSNSSRSDGPPQHSRSSTPEKVSDGEDYGYIMVSPRTNVQRIQVSAISSSRSSSIANGSTRSKRLPLALFDRYSRSPSKQASSIGSADPVLRELGRDDDSDDNDNDNDNDHHHDEKEVVEEDEHNVHGEPDHMFDDGNIEAHMSSGMTHGDNERESVSTAVDATLRMQAAYVARQPEPLIVQSIARSMVGAFMWKYTPTRFTHSNNRERRHMRYFWIHPYAKMLNWSKQPPSGGTGLARSSRDGGSRSVYMRSIRIVDDRSGSSGDGDGNGEPAYCIVVRTDHREIKLKATSQADHDLWYLAMSYLQSRRIITSTTYPTASVAGGVGTARHPDFPSDNSVHSRDTSMGSMESSQRVIINADRRQRDVVEERSRSRSRSRSRPRGPIQSFVDRPPIPLPPPQPGMAAGHLTAPRNAGASSVHLSSSATGTSIGGGSSVRTGGSSAARVEMPEPLSRQRNHRSTLDVTPGRVSSLQSTPNSLRPVSMMPTSATPGTSGGGSKRLSIGLFRKLDGSTSSLLRYGSHASDDSHMSPPLGPTNRDDGSGSGSGQPPSIAEAMTGNRQSMLSGSSNTVRKMFSGSFLRALRSRESVDDVDAT